MKYVLIGTGNISNAYIQAVSELDNSEIVGCVSRSGYFGVNFEDI